MISNVSKNRSRGIRVNKKMNSADDNIAYLFIAPFYILMGVFVILPIIINIALSFTNYNLKSLTFIGIKNYANLFSDEVFIVSLKNTFIYSASTLLFTMVLGLMAALLLKDKIFGIKFFRTAFFIPHVMSMVSVAMVWLWIYEPSFGVANQILQSFNLQGVQWLYNVDTALPAIILMGIWKALGYNMVIFMAGLQGIPRYLYEAAYIDGARPVQAFFKITLPMLTPITFFLFVTGLINNFKVFEQVNIMTNGGPMNSTTTIVHQIYNRAFMEYRAGYAASMAIVLLLIIVVITLINMKFGNQGQELEA